MDEAMELIRKLGFFEKCGFTREQAIEMLKAEQMAIMNSRLSEVVKEGRSDESDTQKGE